jgi:hypothetical protein
LPGLARGTLTGVLGHASMKRLPGKTRMLMSRIAAPSA